MAIAKYSYESEAEIPEKLRELYRNVDGKFIADIEGVKPFDEFKKKHMEAEEARNKAKEYEDIISKYGENTPEVVATLNDKIKELELIASQSKDPAEVQKRAQEIAEFHRKEDRTKITVLETEKSSLAKMIDTLSQEKTQRQLEDRLRKISNGKINPDVFDDVVLNAKYDGLAYRDLENDFYHEKSAMSINEWFSKKLDEKKYWMPYSESGGASGGNGIGGKKGPMSMEDIAQSIINKKK